MSAALQVERRGATQVLTLARPEKMNALSAELVEALIAAVDAAPAQGAEVIVLQGAGRNFSAGFDFGDLDAQSEGDLLLRFVRIETLLQRVAASPCLTVGLAHAAISARASICSAPASGASARPRRAFACRA